MEKAFDPKVYEEIGIAGLILFSIHSLELKKEGCTFERLVKESFSFFPKAFNFPEYTQWPDSRKLDRPLRGLRQKKLISGDPKTFFSLTKKGEKEALEIEKRLKQKRIEFKK